MLSKNNSPGVVTILLTVKPALQTGGVESERHEHTQICCIMSCIMGNEGSSVIGDCSKLET